MVGPRLRRRGRRARWPPWDPTWRRCIRLILTLSQAVKFAPSGSSEFHPDFGRGVGGFHPGLTFVARYDFESAFAEAALGTGVELGGVQFDAPAPFALEEEVEGQLGGRCAQSLVPTLLFAQ